MILVIYQILHIPGIFVFLKGRQLRQHSSRKHEYLPPHFGRGSFIWTAGRGVLRGGVFSGDDFCHVAIKRLAVERNHDHLAAVVVVSPVLILFDIYGRQGEVLDMAVFQQHSGAFHLIPMIDGAVGIADKVFSWVVGHPAVDPVGQAVLGGEVVGRPVLQELTTM